MTEKKGKEKEIREPGKTRKPGEGKPSNPEPAKDDKPKDGAISAEEAELICADERAAAAQEEEERRAAVEAKAAEAEKLDKQRQEAVERAERVEEHLEEARRGRDPGEQLAGCTVTPEGHALGWRPSLPDFRDVAADPGGLRLLEEVDPRADMPPVFDQGQLGSCTANAVAAAIQYDRILDNLDAPELSRLFIYYLARDREGTALADVGSYGRTAFKVLRKTGAPPEELWPYDIEMFDDEPPEDIFDEASEFRVKDYVHPGLGQRVTMLDRKEAFQRLLGNRQTIAFGFTVFESFEGDWEEAGVMPVPEEGEDVLGGHEVLLIGYTADYPEHALCRNSWGSEWGLDGYFYMPWSYLCDPRYSADWRSIYREINA